MTTKKRTPAQILGSYRAAEARKPHPHPAWKQMLALAPELIAMNEGRGYFVTDLAHDRDNLTMWMPPYFYWCVNGGNHLHFPDPTEDTTHIQHTLGGYRTYWYANERLAYLGVLDEDVYKKLTYLWDEALRIELTQGKRRWRPAPDTVTCNITRVVHESYSERRVGTIVKGSEEPSPTSTNALDEWWYWSFLVDFGAYQERICRTRLNRRYEDHGDGKGEMYFVVKN